MSEPGDWSRSPFMADALQANNLTAFRRADAHYLHADRWLQDHVVHAMDGTWTHAIGWFPPRPTQKTLLSRKARAPFFGPMEATTH